MVTALAGLSVLLVGLLAGSAAWAGEPTPLGMQGMQQDYTKGTILGIQGYYEVTPSGAIVLYPSSPVTAPGVMHTILGMFGGTSMINQRGYFQITPKGELFLYFPGGTAWPGMSGNYVMPGLPGQPQGSGPN